jgi:hypothetical protein
METMKLDKFFRKKTKKLYFALVVSDRNPEKFLFTPDKDCKVFMVTGETIPGDVIPRSILRSAMDKFQGGEEKVEEIIITEKKI